MGGEGFGVGYSQTRSRILDKEDYESATNYVVMNGIFCLTKRRGKLESIPRECKRYPIQNRRREYQRKLEAGFSYKSRKE